MSEKIYPLAFDLNGDPIKVPPEAAAWRVRRRSGKQGRPQCIYDRDTGSQVHIAIDATLDDLRDFGAGVYRLDAVDAEGRIIPNIVAQTEVPVEAPEGDDAKATSETIRAFREVVQLLRHSVDTNCRAIEALSSAFGPVRPIAPQQPVVVMGGGEAEPMKAEQVMQVVSQILNAVPQFVQAWNAMKAGMGNGANGTATSTPAADGGAA